MHTPLAPHLHTEECNRIIAKLMQCHSEQTKLAQLFGACNELDTLMRRCTKAERLEREAANHKKAKEDQAARRARMEANKDVDWRDLMAGKTKSSSSAN